MLATTCLAAPIASGPATAQFNLYPAGAISSAFIPYITPNGMGMNYVGPDGTLMNQPGQLWFKLNNGSTTLFTMDTGSTGIIATSNTFALQPGQRPLGTGSQYYSSSGGQLNGQYYAATVNIMGGNQISSPVLATASVVALLAETQTCRFTNKGCVTGGPGTGNPMPPVAYMGVGFDRGDSAITPTYTGPGSTNVNPFINITSVNGTTTSNSNYSQGYIVTNNGIYLGLTNANTANYAFVKLVPNASAAGQQAATWSQAPMTIAVGGATRAAASSCPTAASPIRF